MSWQPIETAPTDGTPVDLWVCKGGSDGKGERFPDMVYSAGDTGTANDWEDKHGTFSLVGDCIVDIEDVTHWMRPPSGPEAL